MTNFSEYYEHQASKHQEYTSFINTLATGFDSAALIAGVKGKERCQEKLEEYNGDFTKIKDILRSTLVVSSIAKAEQVLEAISSTYEIESFWMAFDESDELGYQGGLIKINWNGITVEVQLNTSRNLAAKDGRAYSLPCIEAECQKMEAEGFTPGLGHTFYEKHRTNSTEKVARQSKKYYQIARAI